MGLVECLRLTPPRLTPEHDASISMVMWQAAKQYWQNESGGSTGAAAPPSNGAQRSDSPDHSASASGSESNSVDHEAAAAAAQPPTAAGASLTLPADSYPSNGFHASKEQARFQTRQQIKQEAFTSALWSLAFLGGPALFAGEVEALLRIAR